MPLAGINALIALQISKKIPYKKYLYPSIVFGALFPNLDIIFIYIFRILNVFSISNDSLQRTFTHSLFTIIIVYLIILIAGEIFNKKYLRNIAEGMVIGTILHIILDLIFSFNRIHILWPLPIGYINLWGSSFIPDDFEKIFMAFEFLFFRLYGWILIHISIKKTSYMNRYITYINYWIKLEFILFILFVVGIYKVEMNLFNFLFEIAYIPSLIMAMISTCFMYKSIDLNFK